MLLVLTFGLEAMVELVLILFIVIPNLFRYLRHIKILKRVQDDSKIVLKNIILRQAAIFLPLLIFASWWILTPTNKLGWFFDIMRSDWNPVTVGVGDKWQYLLYFVQSIKTSYTFSNVLFLVILIGFLASLTAFNVKKVRVLAVFFILNFTLGTLHWYNLQDRYIYTSIPVLFLLVGFGWSKVLAKIMGPASGLFLIFALLVLKDFTSLPSYLKANATHMLLSPMYNESDYHDTLFNYDFEKWPRGARSGSARQETTEQVIDYILDKIDINKPIEIVGYTAEISPDWVELRMALRRRDKSIKYKVLSSKYNKFLVTVEVKTTSRLYTYDYKRANAWQLEKVKEIEKNYSDKLIEEKDFKELGVKVKIYENYY
ncbi:hypothetical protein HY030_02285 [Candidatus Gottesmanbacteria bacterium]|nr:hypothetical protein [Candidatus Gottesmanbacteria bacterium]